MRKALLILLTFALIFLIIFTASLVIVQERVANQHSNPFLSDADLRATQGAETFYAQITARASYGGQP